MTKRVLLLGGAGYLGCYIAKSFQNADCFIITIGDINKPVDTKFEFVEIDILNSSLVNSLIEKNDIIINCTGQITNPINFCYRINTIGIENLVNSVNLLKKRLYQISTVSVYGTNTYADENSDLNPESPYAACKAFAEYRISNLIQEKNFCILRIPNLYGGNQSKGLFAYLLKSYLSDRKLHFNNDGTLTRYFLHVEDCADSILSAVNKDLYGTYNVTSNEKYNLKEIIELIEKMTKIKFKTKFDKIKPLENIDEISFKAFSDVTAFSASHNLFKFINETYARYV